MLVITRKSREQLIIGRDIEVTVLKIQGNRVKLGIRGPADVPIHRKELHERTLHHPSHTGPTPAEPRPSVWHQGSPDHDLECRVKRFLEGLNLPALCNLNVEVQNGAAVITGRVSTFCQKQLATSCCQRVAGVLNVINEVRVMDSRGIAETSEDGS